ncbi:hypothetical protein N9W89_04545 [Hellea sp.]|nr:hypothetical protein [Hellea sp.]
MMQTDRINQPLKYTKAGQAKARFCQFSRALTRAFSKAKPQSSAAIWQGK